MRGGRASAADLPVKKTRMLPAEFCYTFTPDKKECTNA